MRCTRWKSLDTISRSILSFPGSARERTAFEALPRLSNSHVRVERLYEVRWTPSVTLLYGKSVPEVHIIWDLDDDPEGNVRHVGEHGLTRAEVDEVLMDPRNPTGESDSS